MSSDALPDSANHAQFATTHWSMVVAAGDKESPQAKDALTALCSTYWYPLYAYARRLGNEAHQAQDLTQAFFTKFLEKDYLKAVNREHGKFRTFLLVSFRNFLANEHDRANAQKRGGGQSVLSLDLEAAEWRTRLEPSHSLTAERLFERRWALTLLEQTLARLRAEFTTSGRGPLFDHLKGCLTGEKPGVRTQELADRLGMTAGAINVAVHRLRQRYRDLLREEIGRTVSDPNDIDGEIRDLFSALG
ncbi:MAG TPA: sigma-70 family RNA polymerase sigma factor [Gemmataceae bacterium]|jgi:RNA polymerase sigma-70 factor (ECF subfamily)|nr:sigma-70 family RNA polymerase sigma factor [Gemmataceae bacterium]